jgi:hypothetical protein
LVICQVPVEVAIFSRVSPMRKATFMIAHELAFSALIAASVPSPSVDLT